MRRAHVTRRWIPRLALAACLGIGACTSRPVAPLHMPAGAGVIDLSTSPAVDDVTTGFELLDPAEGWQPGDTVTFALTLTRGDEARHAIFEITVIGWRMGTVRLTITPKSADARTFEADMIACFVRRLEWDGADPESVRELETRISRIPEPALEGGLFESLEPYASAARDPDDFNAADVGWSMAVFAMSQLFEAGEHEGRFLRSLVRAPSLLSMALNLGVTFSLDYAEPQQPAEPVEVLLDEHLVEGVRARVELKMNGRLALVGSVVSVPVVPPLGPGNGVVLIEARHPTSPDRKATLRLIGAHRGDVPFEGAGADVLSRPSED